MARHVMQYDIFYPLLLKTIDDKQKRITILSNYIECQKRGKDLATDGNTSANVVSQSHWCLKVEC